MFWDFWIEEFDEKILLKLGFKGVCLFGNGESKKIKILKGEKIYAKNGNELKIKCRKSNANFLLLINPNKNVQRVAIRKCLVDGIFGEVGYPLIKEMSKRKISLVLPIRKLMNSTSAISSLSESIYLAKKYKVPIVIVSGAKSKWEIRGPSELIAFGEVFGLRRDEAKKALYEFQDKIWEREELKKEGRYVMPGVKIVEKTV